MRGEPDWVFACYQTSTWPRFIRRLFDGHKLQPEDQRFTANGTLIRGPAKRRLKQGVKYS